MSKQQVRSLNIDDGWHDKNIRMTGETGTNRYVVELLHWGWGPVGPNANLIGAGSFKVAMGGSGQF